MIPHEYWFIVAHEAWEEAIIVHADSPQGAEDAAERVVLEQTAEYRPEGMTDQEWLTSCYEGGAWTIQAAQYKVA